MNFILIKNFVDSLSSIIFTASYFCKREKTLDRDLITQKLQKPLCPLFHNSYSLNKHPTRNNTKVNTKKNLRTKFSDGSSFFCHKLLSPSIFLYNITQPLLDPTSSSVNFQVEVFSF